MPFIKCHPFSQDKYINDVRESSGPLHAIPGLKSKEDHSHKLPTAEAIAIRLSKPYLELKNTISAVGKFGPVPFITLARQLEIIPSYLQFPLGSI